jgi:hypothetical protein
MLSTKNYLNNSSIFATTGKFKKIDVEEAIINNYYNINDSNNRYYTKTYIDSTLSNYSTYINTLSGNIYYNYYIKSEVDGIIAGNYNIIIDILQLNYYNKSSY